MKYPKLRELKEAIVSLVTPAYTTKFPKVPHEPFPNYRGKPVVDDENCVGCETCANVCPPYAITFKDDKEKKIRTIERNYGKCIFCGQCGYHCITQKGVVLSDKIYDIATFERPALTEVQKKELLLCANCNAIITTKEHYKYIHYKLGSQAYSSINNLSMLNERLRLAAEQDVQFDVQGGLKRKDMFNILCPNCLRKTLLKDLL